MSIATISQTVTPPRPARHVAAAQHLDWRRPLTALVAARLCKARIELESSRRTGRPHCVPKPTASTEAAPSAPHGRARGTNEPLAMCAQGDILLERVAEPPTAVPAGECAEPKCIVLARGELSGHCHTVHGRVRLTHHAARARDIANGLYLGHLDVIAGPAQLEHQQHAAIALPPGTYRVRRQRRLEPTDVEIVTD